MRHVLLLGRTLSVVDEALRVQMPDVPFRAGAGIDDVRSAFAQAQIDHVIMGAGLDLDIRLEIVREVFRLSDSTTVHLKDVNSGPEGFLPFVRSVLVGLTGPRE